MKAVFENRKFHDGEFVSVWTINELSFHAHWHIDIEILYVLRGSIEVGVNGESKILQKGEISICASNDIHYYNSIDKEPITVLIIFKKEILDSLYSWSKSTKPVSAFLQTHECDDGEKSISNLINLIQKEYSNKGELYVNMLNVYMCELMLNIFRLYPDYYESSKNYAKRVVFDQKPMQVALKFIESNYSEEITLGSIAAHASLSEYYFSRLFKDTTGTNFNTYLSYIRIRNAQHYIRTTQKNIIDIAYECGFRSIRTFNRTFKRFIDMTPHEYRDM